MLYLLLNIRLTKYQDISVIRITNFYNYPSNPNFNPFSKLLRMGKSG